MSYIDDEDDDFYCYICGEFANPAVWIRGILYCKECGDIIRYGRKEKENA